ncbi:unnamed protein product [Arctogadus glacialis]
MVLAMEDTRPNGLGAEEDHPSETTAALTPTTTTTAAAGTGQPTREGRPADHQRPGAPDPEPAPAMQQALDHPGEVPPASQGAKDIDLLFLRGIMESPTVRSPTQAQEQVEEVKLEAVQDNNVELVTEILGDISSLQVRDDSATELSKILQEPHFQSLLEAHDIVASKCYEVPPPTEMANDAAVNNALMQADAVRMIGIRKKAGEPLGVTFRVDKEDLVIARILHGGMIDRQGLLHVGDIIKEVNGQDVGNHPTELQDLLKDCSGGITLKILPSYRDAPAPPQVVDTGRTCILDVNPQALKVLKTAEFMPYVVFIAAPEFDTLKAMHKAVVDAGITTKQLTDVDLRKTVDESARIQRAYNHYFDLTIVNDNLDKAFETLQGAVDKLCSEAQWVPVNWVY